MSTSTAKMSPSVGVLSTSTAKMSPSVGVLSTSTAKMSPSVGVLSTSTAKMSPSVGVSLSINLVEVLKYVILAAPILYIYRYKPQDVFLEELKGLRALRTDTEKDVKKEEWRNRRRRKEELQGWMDDVDSFLENEVRVFETSYFRRVPFVCHVYCWLLNLSNRVERLRKCRGEIQGSLVGATPLPTLPEDPSKTVVGGEDTLAAIRGHIREGDAVKMVGIYGMAGVGKSTYMKVIAHELREGADTKDDLIIWVSLSTGEPIYPNLQNAIGDQLGLSSSENLTAGIRDMLGGSKFFLFLDGVQDVLKWDDIGIPLPKPGDKIIFTTRSWRICKDLKAQRIMKVNLLNQVKSRDLFRTRLVGTAIVEGNHIECLADSCGGLPHALVTVADALPPLSDVADALPPLSDRRGDWKMASDWWSAPTSGLGMPVVITSLIPALEIFKPYLTPSNKPRGECLLYCCLFPRGQSICSNKLVDYWMGEGFLDDRSRLLLNWSTIRNLGSQLISDLKNDCLLESGGDQWKVRLHDVVSRAAVWLTASDQVDQSNIYLTSAKLDQLPEGQVRDKAWKYAKRISYVGSNGEVWLPDNKSKCSNLLTLLLYNYNDLIEAEAQYRNGILPVPPNLYYNMSKLRVLDMSGLHIDQHLTDITLLVHLHYLNLSYTNIRTLPRGLQRMEKLRQLNLRGTSFLECIPEDSITKLVSLQALDLFASNYIWEWKWQGGRRVSDNIASTSSNTPEKQVDLCCLEGLHDLCELGLTITGRSPCLQELLNSCLRVSVVFLQLDNVEQLSREHLTYDVGNMENLRELCIKSPQPVELNISHHQLQKLEFLSLTNVVVVVSPAAAPPLLEKLRSLVISYQNLAQLLSWVRLIRHPAQVMISPTGPGAEEPMSLERFISRVSPNWIDLALGELRLNVVPAMQPTLVNRFWTAAMDFLSNFRRR